MEFITLIVEQLIGPVKRHLGFLVCSSNHVTDMKARFVRLKATAADIKTKKAEHGENSQSVSNHVPVWLTEFEKINEEVEKITTGGDACFNIKKRYQAGKKSSKIITRIDDLEKQKSNIEWTEKQIPLAKVTASSMPSTSGPVHADADDAQNIIFKSRKLIFQDVLKALDPSTETQKMALCGLGGVGKTTMMEELKKVVERKGMFDHVVRVVIGEKTDMASVQRDIAEFVSLPLSETAEAARKDRLKHKFSDMSENGSKKILVILDDVWKMVDLEIIGLASPLPSGFKLFLTSRDEMVCTQMGVETKSIFRMVGLAEEEAKRLFWETIRVSSNDNGADDEYRKLGDAILEMCGGLPLAIKTIALSLKGAKKHAWKVALRRLQRHDLANLKGIVRRIFKISYENLSDDDKAIFVLCGLFPDDFHIPVEDLTRYGWGLKLFYGASSLAEARERTKASVDSLKGANLLTESYYTECVKMHDLARAFVLNSISKFKQASIVNHGNDSEWPTEDTKESCERILVNCDGMSKFAQDFNYPNLVLLKLMANRNKINLEFPEDFYQRLVYLQVISYKYLEFPLLRPVSLQCSASLRTLCLHSCSLPVDISFLGDLTNMEVLSLAHSSIRKLPSTIEKLRKLKLLDLTRCVDLCVDAGVFLKLVKLEELYIVGITFTEDSFNEVVILPGKLSALEVEFFGNILQPKNVSFKKLERFGISVGVRFNYITNYSSKNTLKLATNRRELLECKINELFVKTEELELSVKDLNHLEEILPPPSHCSFCTLKILVVSDCVDLKCLFTIPVAERMTQLESLTVSSCPVLKSVIHTENGGVREISFPKLKSLTLEKLPDLVSFFESVMNVMELPQLMKLNLDDLPNITSIFMGNNSDISSTILFLSKKAVIPNLGILQIRRMEELKEIWSASSDSEEESLVMELPQLKWLKLEDLPNFTSIFSGKNDNKSALQPFFNKEVVIPKLETLIIKRMEKLKEIWSCSSGSEEEVSYNISMLRKIEVEECDGVVNMFPSNPMRLLIHLEELRVKKCGSIEELFKIDLGKTQQLSSNSSLRSIYVEHLEKLREVWRIKDGENSSPPLLNIRAFKAVESIHISNCEKFRNVFTPTTAHFDLGALKEINIDNFFGKFESGRSNAELVEKNSQEQEINIEAEGEVHMLAFSSHDQLTPTCHQLRKIYFEEFKGVEVVFEIEKESSPSINTELVTTPQQPLLLLLPSLEELSLYNMNTLTHVWKCNWNEFYMKHQPQSSSSSFQNLTTIRLGYCKGISYLFSPLMAKLLSNLKTIHITCCDGIEEVVSSRYDAHDQQDHLHLDMNTATTNNLFPRLETLRLGILPNLKHIGGAGGVAEGSTNTICDNHSKFSQADVVSWSLYQYAREISIFSCPSIVEVFETREMSNRSGSSNCTSFCQGSTHTALTIPRQKDITMHKLSNLKMLNISYCRRLEFIFPFSALESLSQLEKLIIKECKAMKVIVKEENREQITGSNNKVVVFSRLESIQLEGLPNLAGFFLGKNAFAWPLLNFVLIDDCPRMKVFTSGESGAPELNYIHTRLGRYNLECGLNFHLTPTSHQTPSPSLDDSSSSSPAAISQKTPWTFQNLIEINMKRVASFNPAIPFAAVLHLQKLEKIHLDGCLAKGVFEVGLEVVKSGQSKTVVKFPKLKEVKLMNLGYLEYIRKSNRWIILEFPNLTTLFISNCNCLKHVLTCSMVSSLIQLQELHINCCQNIEVIVKQEDEEECDVKVSSEIKQLPCLKSLQLERLPSLEGFCLGINEDFILPSLTTLVLKKCPKLKTFTKGHLAVPELKLLVIS